ncbi:TetR/AcrR family transcriptional regulator [Leuconostoc sp. MTCC 10508]|uniref:TetR/AcrR family transcriptional regulator n=1 Tax=Leuconostoc sp. MTCC 10508 TaxID=2698683 RepID=UPI0020BF1FDE|nr:TetR/AcrR family transcriptional regulator [Leuconostoc sp. MTCC 10508]
MEKIDKRVQKTDYFIQKAFFSLLNQKAFEQITIKNICETALISKSTFYDHYPDKYSLLDSLVDKYSQKYKTEIHSRFKSVEENRTLQVISKMTTEMSSESQNISALLKITGQHSLINHLREILYNESLNYFSNNNINNRFSKEFLSNMYTGIALESIMFILDNSNNIEMLKQHSDFVGVIQEGIIAKINSKNTN